MNNKHMINDIFDRQCYDYCTEIDFCHKDNLYLKDGRLHHRYDDFCLEESDFYQPTDNRILKSYVSDIYGGDNFADYCKYIFDIYEEEGYYD